jgi:hypothetical protein
MRTSLVGLSLFAVAGSVFEFGFQGDSPEPLGLLLAGLALIALAASLRMTKPGPPIHRRARRGPFASKGVDAGRAGDAPATR